MRLIKKLLITIPVVLILLSGSVCAKNNVSQIDIFVVVRDDASACITQTWHGQFSEGTENYIPIATGDISISDLKVYDEKGSYTVLDEWDIDAGFDEKSRKCGINETSDGVELCFGISEYGENTYNIEYVVTDFIKSYTDYDGTNFMFINPNMSTFPTDGHIAIYLENGIALNEDNARIWGFGFDGMVEFQNGAVKAWTTSELEDNASMKVMLQLDKGLVHPTKFMDTSFEDVKQRAFEGSDYGSGNFYDNFALILLIGIVVFVLVLILAITIIRMIKRKKAIKKFYNDAEYFRNVPNDGKIEISHFLAQTFDVANEESLIIGALMLSMINKGFIEPMIDQNVGMFGRVKESVNIKLINEPDTVIETCLYKILVSAAGADGVLQEKELEKYAYRNPEKINSLIAGIKQEGQSDFIKIGGFINGTGTWIKDLSERGKSELAQVMGLKKYLDEFSLISERSIDETVIWKEYMVYATLFGVADKVIKQLEQVYPDRIPEFEAYNTNVIIAHSYYHTMHRSVQMAVQQQRTSGIGGHSSFGGGGGFSGGGIGGGSR